MLQDNTLAQTINHCSRSTRRVCAAQTLSVLSLEQKVVLGEARFDEKARDFFSAFESSSSIFYKMFDPRIGVLFKSRNRSASSTSGKMSSASS